MLKDILFIIISGVALAASFPPVDLGFFAWAGLVPLFFALDGKRGGKRFLIGLFWGFVFFMGTVYWVVNSMVNYGGVPVLTSVFILILLALYLSLYPALFGLCFTFLKSSTRPWLSIFLIPSLWISSEYIRTNLIAFGFPWVLLGYSQSSFLSLIQMADITGVYGVSFLIVMVNVFVFMFIRGQGSKVEGQNREKEVKYFSPFTLNLSPFLKEGIIVFAVIAGVLIYGFQRIYGVDEKVSEWKTLKVGIVQGNIDQAAKWDASFQRETVDIYRNLSLDLAGQRPELIIWPETAVPFYLQADKVLGPLIFNVPKETHAHLFTGTPAYGLGFGGEIKYYNSAFLLSPKGEIVGRYDKIHLVPFGEYVPMKRFLPFIQKLVVGVGDFSSGTWLKPIALNDTSFGVLICFESIFPELSRGVVKEGAGFLVNITNDAWFGRTSAPYQHFSQAIFRGVENRVFLLRAANTGISGAIDPVGRVLSKSALFSREAIVENVRIKDEKLFTFYTRYGDIFSFGCLIISAMGLGLWMAGFRKNNS